MKAPDTELFSDNKGQRGATVKELLLRYLTYWPLFVLSFIICLTFSYLYLRHATPQYSASTLVLVKDDKSKTEASNDLIKEALTGEQKDNLDNEIQIMHSSRLMERVVTKNQFNISYYRKGKFRTTDLYLEAPFRLVPQHIADSNTTVSLTLTQFTPPRYHCVIWPRKKHQLAYIPNGTFLLP